MTNKERFIKAIKEIERPSSHYEDCLLCQIVDKKHNSDWCKPCPLSTRIGHEGCEGPSRLFRKLLTRNDSKGIKAIKAGLIKIIEGFPDKDFTKANWRYHSEIHSYLRIVE